MGLYATRRAVGGPCMMPWSVLWGLGLREHESLGAGYTEVTEHMHAYAIGHVM